MQQATTLYPLKSSQVDSGGAVNIYNLSDTQPGADDTTTSCLNGAKNQTVERTFSPGAANNTDANNAATTSNSHGWAIPVADMATGDPTNCIATLVAQTVTVNLLGTATSTGTATGNDSFIPRASLWKWNPTTNVATFICGASGTQLNKNGVAGYTAQPWASAITLTLPATTFAAGEILLLVAGGSITTANAVGAHTSLWGLTLDNASTSVVFGTSGLFQACTGTSSISATSSLTVTGKANRAGTSSISATATVTATGQANRSGTSAESATAGVTSTGTAARRGTGTITASPSVTGDGGKGDGGTAAITAAATVTASGTAGRRGTTAVSAVSALTGSGLPGRAGTTSVSASAATTGNGTASRFGTSSINATTTITGDGGHGGGGDAAITATATVTAAGVANRFGTSAIPTATSIIVTGTAARTGTVVIDAPVTVVIDGTTQRFGTGTIDGLLIFTVEGIAEITGLPLDIKNPRAVLGDTNRGAVLTGASRRGVTTTDDGGRRATHTP